jgi:hypothetical protein
MLDTSIRKFLSYFFFVKFLISPPPPKKKKLPIIHISSLLAADAKTIRVFVLVKKVSVVHIFTLPAVSEKKWWGLWGGQKKCQLCTFLHCSQQAKNIWGVFLCQNGASNTHFHTARCMRKKMELVIHIS